MRGDDCRKNDTGHESEVTVKETMVAVPMDRVDDGRGAAVYDDKSPLPDAAATEDEQPLDPWALPELSDQGVKWAELTFSGKIHRVFLTITKICALLLLLYLFICSLDFLASAFRLLGGKAAGKVFQQNELLRNPVVGVMIGVLATVLVQSSSTSTSIVVTMVGADFLNVKTAIPIVMGANIGTSVTNTIVSLAHSSDKNEFRRAFAGATVHDMFNWLSVIVLLPIEASFGYLFYMTDVITSSVNWQTSKSSKKELLKVITKPFTKKIIQLDKKVITAIAKGEETHDSLIKECCKRGISQINVTDVVNGTAVVSTRNVSTCAKPCKFLLHGLGWGDSYVGILLLVLALLLLCTCLVLLVKLLHSMLKGRIAVMIKKMINADFPGPCSYFTGYIAILVGCGMTILVQSSSIFTSAMTPLVGIGVISLERMYPLTLGSNIGTTATGILASFASSQDKLHDTLQIALCHFFFNVSGILLFYPIPFTRIPITLAKKLGNTTAKYRWFAIFYLVMMFFLLPAVVFGLSVAGSLVFTVVGSIFLILAFVIVLINILQSKRPSVLPERLRSWSWLPKWMHSLQPLDDKIRTVRLVAQKACICCKKSMSHNPSNNESLYRSGKSVSQIPIAHSAGYENYTMKNSGTENLSYNHTHL